MFLCMKWPRGKLVYRVLYTTYTNSIFTVQYFIWENFHCSTLYTLKLATKLSNWFAASTYMYCIFVELRGDCLVPWGKNLLVRGPMNCCKCGQLSILQCISAEGAKDDVAGDFIYFLLCSKCSILCFVAYRVQSFGTFSFQMLFIYCAFHFTEV